MSLLASYTFAYAYPLAPFTVLEKLSPLLAASVNHQDPAIDQLLMIKQMAWLLRLNAGESSLIVGNALGSGNRPFCGLSVSKQECGCQRGRL